jgi:hypothetical protein
MSTENQYQPQQPQYQPQQYDTNVPWKPQPPKKPSKLKRFGFAAGTLMLAVILGSAVGASAVPEPVEIVKVEVKEKIVTKEVKVPITPESCKTALTFAGQVHDLSAEAMGYSSDATKAAARLNVAGVTTATQNIDSVTQRLKAISPQYLAARDSCRAG